MRERVQSSGRIRALGILAVLGACATPGGEAAPPISPALEAGSRPAVVGGVEHWYRVPVLFLHGGPGEGSDRFATFAGPRLEDARIRATLLELEDAGHFMYIDDPDRFAREVRRFLRGSR